MEEYAKIIAYKSLSAPVILILETIKPVSRVFSSFLNFIEPFGTFIINPNKYANITNIMENPKNIEKFILLIEKFENVK